MTVTTRATTCEVCGSARLRVLRHSDLWGFDVGRCRDCRMVFVLDPPPPQEVESAYIDGGDPTPYVEIQRADDRVRPRVLDRLAELLGPPAAGRQHELFDVGAGVGDFLVQAREHGFAISGNEIAPAAIAFTRERHGIELSPLLLDEQPPASADAITMWCVLAHVNDPEQLLAECFAQLRPGGVLFLRTPRWCVVDTAATALARATRGRLATIADRRVNRGHLHHYGSGNLTTLLQRVGFVEVEALPSSHFPLSTDTYLQCAGGAGRALAVFSRGLDRLIQRDLFVRNALLVYARKPS